LNKTSPQLELLIRGQKYRGTRKPVAAASLVGSKKPEHCALTTTSATVTPSSEVHRFRAVEERIARQRG